MKSYTLKGGALMYICTNQQSGQWLIRATDNHRLESGARMRDKVAQTLDKLPKWIKNLNPGLHTKHWRIPDKQSELKNQRLIP
jgi:hypothetical protein